MWLTLTDRLKKTLTFYRTTVEPCKKVHEYPLSEWKLHALRVLGVLKSVYIIYLGGMPPLSL
jgi:hypothetical protein